MYVYIIHISIHIHIHIHIYIHIHTYSKGHRGPGHLRGAEVRGGQSCRPALGPNCNNTTNSINTITIQ